MSSDNDIVLSVKNVSKCFEMYEKPVHRLYQTLCAGKKRFYKEFWALRDINFEVRKGECVGIIGRNGAGKSTLLQIITGTLAPTTGEVKLKGRVAALLELGSGFNPEFTGKENVYLNGSILGLSKAEIDARYQDILDFADIGEFIDQPVKTYSSGMMVRLAFAVQVMVEPDILIVDEALAVGDAAFQRKCFARMDALQERGTTILLVTHDTETVKRRCDRAIFLKDHRIEMDATPEDAVVSYMRYLFPVEEPARFEGEEPAAVENRSVCRAPSDAFVFEKKDLSQDSNQWGVGGGRIRAIRIYGLEPPCILRTPCAMSIEVDAVWDAGFACQKILEERLAQSMMIGIRIADRKNTVVFGTNNSVEGRTIDPASGRCSVSFAFELPMLRTDEYFITAAISLGSMLGHVHLVWDDLAIQLHGEGDSKTDGVIHCPVEIEVR